MALTLISTIANRQNIQRIKEDSSATNRQYEFGQGEILDFFYGQHDDYYHCLIAPIYAQTEVPRWKKW